MSVHYYMVVYTCVRPEPKVHFVYLLFCSAVLKVSPNHSPECAKYSFKMCHNSFFFKSNIHNVINMHLIKVFISATIKLEHNY